MYEEVWSTVWWSVLVLAWKLLIVPTFWFHEWLVHALKIFPISYVISHSSLFSGCVMLAEPSILGHNQKSPSGGNVLLHDNMEVSEITYWTAKFFHKTWLTTATICVMHHHLTLFSLLWEDKMGSHHVKSNWRDDVKKKKKKHLSFSFAKKPCLIFGSFCA